VIPRRYKILVCRGPECGDRFGSQAIHAALVEAIRRRGVEARVELGWQACFGRCRHAPNVLCRPINPMEKRFLIAAAPLAGGPGTAFYSRVAPADAARIIDQHVLGGQPLRELILRLDLEPPEPPDRGDR
jgi:(2Fe-2S) ferredoxin